MSEHVCACGVCSEEIAEYGYGPQKGPRHRAIRFKNADAFRGATVDGVEIPSVTDALIGPEGFVVSMGVDESGHRHICQSGDPLHRGAEREPCKLVTFGRVEMLLKDLSR